MKRFALLAAVAAATLVSGVAQAQQATEGNWMVRVRALKLDPADKSDATGAIPADAITVSDKTIPEIDISYFWTQNIATELVLTVPQKHDVYLQGAGKIGSFKELPPTLMVQYHFAPEETFRPYVGAGVNYTNIHNVELPAGMDLESHSWGFALQAGFDVKIGPQTFINFDVKKVQISTDVLNNGTRLSTVHVDPLLWGVGVGYRF